jgi:S-DNA-T family DNA segregation ATPase FtsK/SpoIIIE
MCTGFDWSCYGQLYNHTTNFSIKFYFINYFVWCKCFLVGGAEKLLGAGDMLYSGGEGQPERVQSAYISESELKNVVKYLVDSFKDEVPSEIELSGSISADKSIFDSQFGDDDTGDDLYEDARQVVIEAGKASTSYLQRKLGVGYARAAKLIDMLEEKGIVGPGNGSKPREVLEQSVAAESEGFQ